jgi:hypothetical protein
MTKIKQSLFFSAIVLSLFQVSCKNKFPSSYETEVSDEMRSKILSEQSEGFLKDIKFPSLSLRNGQSLTIQYSSSGCFHYQRETVTIKRINDKYLLSASNFLGESEGDLITDSLVQNSIVSNLIFFQQYCKQKILENNEKLKNQWMNSTSSKGIFIQTKGDSIHFLLNPNISFSLLEWFTNRGRFSKMYNVGKMST